MQPAARHLLAALAYDVVIGHRQYLALWFGNLSIHIRRAAVAGGRYEPPRLADLLARPEFDPRRQFLTERGVDPAELQAALDQLIAQAGGE